MVRFLRKYHRRRLFQQVHILDAKESSLSPNLKAHQFLLENGIRNIKKYQCWYNAWLTWQLDQQPLEFFEILGCKHEKQDSSPAGRELFANTFLKIAEYIVSTESISVDGIISQLRSEKLIDDNDNLYGHDTAVSYFVCSVLGWQTMLFRPRRMDSIYFEIVDEQAGTRGHAYMSLQVEIARYSQKPLSEFLMEFGVLLPSKDLCLSEDREDQSAFQEMLQIDVKTFNAYFLTKMAGIKLKWVDTLACHMEYNPKTKELYLFRFPSFCLLSHRSSADSAKTVIHTCATTAKFHCQWATEDDIDCMLSETLLSYRLLFGQGKKSRTLFRSINNPFRDVHKDVADPLLPLLCGRKACPDVDLAEREIYHLPRDFPIFRSRISVLQRHLSRTAPRTWLQLWRDNRDSAQWLTLWALLAFGIFGILLALMQVILQFIQLLAP